MSIPLSRISLYILLLSLFAGVQGCGGSTSDGPDRSETDAPKPQAEADVEPTTPAVASAEIALSWVFADLPGLHASPGTTPDLSRHVQTELNALLAEDLLAALVGREAVQATAWFNPFAGDRDAAALALRENVLVAEPIAGTLRIHLTATAGSEDDAIALLNQWTELYLVEAVFRLEDPYTADHAAARQEVSVIANRLELNEEALRRLQNNYPRNETRAEIQALLEEPLEDNTVRLEQLRRILAEQDSVEREIALATQDLAAARRRQRAVEALARRDGTYRVRQHRAPAIDDPSP